MTTRHEQTRYVRIWIALSLAASILAIWLVSLGDVWAAGGDETAPQAPSQSMVGINGNPCSYATISDAIAAASSGGTIYIPSGHIYSEMLGTIDKDLTLVAALSDCSGPDPGVMPTLTRIDGGGSSGGIWGGIATIGSNTTVTFSHLTLENATASYGGIAYVDPDGRLILDRSIVRFGTAANSGGGVRVYFDAALEVRNGSLIYFNEVTGTTSGGGGVAVYQGAMTMTESSSIGLGNGGNTSAGDGGGILLESSNLYIEDSFLGDNDAADDGGGIMAFGSSVIELHGYTTIGGGLPAYSNTATLGGGVYVAGPTAGIVLFDTSQIQGNSASEEGGGVYAAAGAYVTVEDDAGINNNSAGQKGGGVYLAGEDTRLNMIYGGGEIRENDAQGFSTGDGGGGVYLEGGASVYAEGAQIISNTTGLRGGGILVGSDAVPTQTSVILNNGALLGHNTADLGGGMYVDDGDASIVVDGSWVEWNEASTTGGGIRLFGDSEVSVINGSTISGNTAGRFGGGLAAFTGTVTFDNAAIEHNTATFDDGGGVDMSRGDLTVINSTVNFNTAGDAGGGIIASLGVDLQFYTSYGAGSNECDPFQLPAGVYCTEVRGNKAQGWGAGVYLYDTTATIVSTAFLDNVGLSPGTSPGTGLLIREGSSVVMANALLSGNGANDNNTVHVYTDGFLASYNSTYAGNLDVPLYAVSGSTVTLDGNVIWGNGSVTLLQPDVYTTTACNDSVIPLNGPGDISADPYFVTTTRGAYRLGPFSPAIDACATGTLYDLDGRSRPIDGDGDGSADYDMGAFEQIPYRHLFIPLAARES